MKTILVLVTFLAMTAQAETSDQYLIKFLESFSKNPAETSREIPPKFFNDERIADPATVFRPHEIQNNQFVEIKDQLRRDLCKSSKPGRPCMPIAKAEIDQINEPSLFFLNTNYSKKFNDLKDLNENQTHVTPWSGDYWPTFKMGLARRYADPSYPNWGTYNDFLKFFSGLSSQEEILDILSPAEKYDLLLGDLDKTLTRWSVDDGSNAYMSDGSIEGWFGICHGWAAASFHVPRPQKTVSITLQDGRELKFFPHDLKGLASLLWANATLQNRSIGGRCNDKSPPRDPTSGRILSKNCFDINPGSWHATVLNQVGKNKKSFVLDATYDYQVWNQPIVSYKLTYFNPATGQVTDAENSIARKEDYIRDPYSAYRSRNSAYIMGVSMKITYVAETGANSMGLDSTEMDARNTVLYIYDLELDKNKNIIGGEWYQNAHPDFLWAPYENARAVSVADHYINENWTGVSAPPFQWKNYAQLASNYGQPLAKVVEHLIQLSQNVPL